MCIFDGFGNIQCDIQSVTGISEQQDKEGCLICWERRRGAGDNFGGGFALELKTAVETECTLLLVLC